MKTQNLNIKSLIKKLDNNYIIRYESITSLDQKEMFDILPIDIVDNLQNNNEIVKNNISSYEDYYFGIIDILSLDDVFGNRDKLAIYISKDMLFIIEIFDYDSSTYNSFIKCLDLHTKNNTIGKFISSFLKLLIRDHLSNYDVLRNKIEIIDDKVLEANTDKKIVSEISEINHSLLELYSYYEQLSDAIETLSENENDIFEDEDILYYKNLQRRLDRYSLNIQLLREYINQVRESYQAQMDISLNKIMKIFTVVTTIFLPLSLIVGWYGMNFTNMPELKSAYGYPSVIVLSLLTATGCILFFKKKNLL